MTFLNNKLHILSADLTTNKIDIAFVTETWWTAESSMGITGYDLYYTNRRNRNGRVVKGGGVCIYVKKSITSHEVDNLVLLSQDCEQIWCVVKHGCESILCGAIYRPPECKEGVWDTAINNSLEFASNAKFDGVLICGDFNHPAVNWSDEGHPFIGAEAQNSNISDQFVDSVLNLDLVQMIKEPTFIGRGGILTGNILDLIFTDLNQRVRGIIHDEPLDYKVQGHHVLTFDYYVKSSPIKSVVSPDKLNYRRGDYKGLSEYFDKFQDQWMGYSRVEISMKF